MSSRVNDRDKKGSSRSGKGSSSNRQSDPSLMGRYYTAIENLILFLFSRSRYLEALKSMVRTEVDYRTGLVVKGAILLTLSLFFLFSTMAFLSVMTLLSIQRYTENWIISAGILFAISMAFFLILLLLARDQLAHLTEKRPARKARP